MQSSPNSALLTFPLEEGSEGFKPFIMWWLNYINIVVKLSDDFADAEAQFPTSFWDIDRDQDCLFLSTPILQILNRTKSKRLYFIGQDLTGKIETNLRVASALQFDPVLVWNSETLGEITESDKQRLSCHCQIAETSDFLEGFERGWVDFRTPPRGMETTG